MQKTATTNKCEGTILFCLYQYKKIIVKNKKMSRQLDGSARKLEDDGQNQDGGVSEGTRCQDDGVRHSDNHEADESMVMDFDLGWQVV